MIISASRRTDIPAFYSEWMLNRLRDGFAITRNPYHPEQTFRVNLTADVVDAIVFWTKDATPLLPHLNELDSFDIPYYFQFTLTPYHTDLEPGVPADKSTLVSSFKTLAAHVGSNRVIWRYDPILFSEKYNLDYHKRAFARCTKLLAGATNRVVISFLDIDYKTTKAFATLGITDGTTAQKTELATFIAAEAAKHGMTVESCAEAIDLASCGVKHGCCIDGGLIEEITGRTLGSKGHTKDASQRKLCGCVNSIDLGVYNTCTHGCRYCYANFAGDDIAANVAAHDPQSPVLIGQADASTAIPRKNQVSFFVD